MSYINTDIYFDKELTAKIEISEGWNVKKIHYSENDPLVALECRSAFNGAATVLLDLKKAEFRSSFPEPFTRKPVEDLAGKIGSAICYTP